MRIKTKSGDEVPLYNNDVPKLLPRVYDVQQRRAIKLNKSRQEINILNSMNLARVSIGKVYKMNRNT